jgi:Ca-activated chloride channel family protein
LDLHGIHFANPTWLLGLLALPFAALAVYFLSQAKHKTFFLGNPKLVGEVSDPISVQAIPPVLRFIVLALCLLAAARPQAGQKKVEEKKPVTDLFVAFDVSSSMLTNDLKPNRVTAAKKVLAEFLDKIQNVRVGLTVFAGVSFTQCPLTTDMEVVKKLLANVEIGSVKIDQTAIGDALVSCLNRLQNGSGKTQAPTNTTPSLVSKLFGQKLEGEENKPNSQAILLMTDGGNNAGHLDPLTAAKIAVSRGVKIYAIGMGSVDHRVPALYQLPDGRTTYGLDQSGNVIMADLADMGLLKEIARITGGKAYSAGDNNTLKSVLDEIAKMEKRDVSVTVHWEYQELASFFLIAAFILLALDLGLETTVLRTLP